MYEVPSKYLTELLNSPPNDRKAADILDSASASSPVRLEDAAVLMLSGCVSAEIHNKIIKRAGNLAREVFGKKVKLFVPLYLSNICVNNCLYCGYRAENMSMPRRTLAPDEFKRELEEVTGLGYRVIELVTSESPELKREGVLEEYVRIAREVLDQAGPDESGNSPELILMSWLLDTDRFKSLKDAGLDAFYLWQETYDREQFEKFHPSGNPKSDYNRRIEVFDNAIRAGIDKVGLGVLFGLGDWKRDVLSLIGHGRHIEKTYGINPEVIGIPRFKHAEGAPMIDAPFPVSDNELKLAVALYRLAFPTSHVFLNTREKLGLILDLLDSGGSEMNISCAVYPGGYTEPSDGRQFEFYNLPMGKTVEMLGKRGYEATHFRGLQGNKC